VGWVWTILLVGFVCHSGFNGMALNASELYKVIRVYDGDTVLVSQPQKKSVKVRLIGIDAPEMYKKDRMPAQPYSRKAKRYLSKRVLHRQVHIDIYGRDRYGRILGVLLLDDADINLEMIQSGLAEVYRGKMEAGFDAEPYREAQADARQSKRGIWSQGKRYVSPIKWKIKYQRK
jgi:endonuclease YncB( thermonuclease family)